MVCVIILGVTASIWSCTAEDLKMVNLNINSKSLISSDSNSEINKTNNIKLKKLEENEDNCLNLPIPIESQEIITNPNMMHKKLLIAISPDSIYQLNRINTFMNIRPQVSVMRNSNGFSATAVDFDKFLITNGDSKEAKFYFRDRNVELATIMRERRRYCEGIPLNQTSIFVCGGTNNYGSTEFFDMNLSKWFPGPTMLDKRNHFGLVNSRKF